MGKILNIGASSFVMSSLVKSVSYRAIGIGLIPILMLTVLVILQKRISIPIVATFVVSFVLLLGGLKPFGDTYAHRILLFTVVVLWALSFIVVEGVSVLSAVVGVTGLFVLSIILYKAIQNGLWTSVALDTKD